MATQHPFGWQFIDRKAASASATIEFDLPTGFAMYRVYGTDIIPASNDVELWMRFSNDAGVSFEADSNDYAWSIQSLSASNTNRDETTLSATEMQIVNDDAVALVGMGNAATHGASFDLCLYSALSTAIYTRATWSFAIIEAVGNQRGGIGQGWQDGTAEITDAIQFLMETGNIASGAFDLYGLKAAA